MSRTQTEHARPAPDSVTKGTGEHGQRLRPLGRLEAFADGVFAIAITLLVLEIAVPTLHDGHLLPGLVDQWPSFLAYLISFFTIGTVWINHYGISRSLRGVDEVFLRLNLLLLFFVAFLPYPTKLVAEFLTEPGPERVAVTVYALTFLAISITQRVTWSYAAENRRLLADDVSDEQVVAASTALTPVLVFYVIAVLVGLALPQVAVALLALAIIYQALPTRTIYRALRRKPL